MTEETVRPDGANDRCVIVVDEALPVGRAANAAAVVALTIGRRHPGLVGDDLVDAGGGHHPGLIPIGISVLAATAADLVAVRGKALARGIDVVDFPTAGQETTDYAAFGDAVARTPAGDLGYVAVGLVGARREVGKVVGRLPLLR
ncbi:DUF2000 domain-containing protein [Pinisolibacter sp.]|uniref:DUF2000 domain-containing protein n=1 Tax=Pinisolibacter sp. TaxID=2172024 RepID=UPI002FDD7E87